VDRANHAILHYTERATFLKWLTQAATVQNGQKIALFAMHPAELVSTFADRSQPIDRVINDLQGQAGELPLMQYGSGPFAASNGLEAFISQPPPYFLAAP
jgi:hypothetical protein